LAGRFGNVGSVVNGIPFNPDEYVFEGVAQINGMSGGATLNGIGYTGLVHGENQFPSGAHLAVVIPASTIAQGLPKIPVHYLKTLGDCPGTICRCL
jgi:hypothetical protein